MGSGSDWSSWLVHVELTMCLEAGKLIPAVSAKAT
jgi:hypothetical protein